MAGAGVWLERVDRMASESACLPTRQIAGLPARLTFHDKTKGPFAANEQLCQIRSRTRLSRSRARLDDFPVCEDDSEIQDVFSHRTVSYGWRREYAAVSGPVGVTSSSDKEILVPLTVRPRTTSSDHSPDFSPWSRLGGLGTRVQRARLSKAVETSSREAEIGGMAHSHRQERRVPSL